MPARWIKRSGAEPLTTADLCVRGMFLFTDELANVGEVLKVELMLTDGPLVMMVVVKNRSRRAGRRGIGVEIYRLDDIDSARWRSFCIAIGCETSS